jgi:hypothetical protein
MDVMNWIYKGWARVLGDVENAYKLRSERFKERDELKGPDIKRGIRLKYTYKTLEEGVAF